jgi:hypothetical protein
MTDDKKTLQTRLMMLDIDEEDVTQGNDNTDGTNGGDDENLEG